MFYNKSCRVIWKILVWNWPSQPILLPEIRGLEINQSLDWGWYLFIFGDCSRTLVRKVQNNTQDYLLHKNYRPCEPCFGWGKKFKGLHSMKLTPPTTTTLQ